MIINLVLEMLILKDLRDVVQVVGYIGLDKKCLQF